MQGGVLCMKEFLLGRETAQSHSFLFEPLKLKDSERFVFSPVQNTLALGSKSQPCSGFANLSL